MLNEPGRRNLGCLFEKVETEKKRKRFSVFYEKRIFFNGNHQKFRPKKWHLIKRHSVSERANFGLSSHAFIFISSFFTKIDFFRGGEGWP